MKKWFAGIALAALVFACGMALGGCGGTGEAVDATDEIYESYQDK